MRTNHKLDRKAWHIVYELIKANIKINDKGLVEYIGKYNDHVIAELVRDQGFGCTFSNVARIRKDSFGNLTEHPGTHHTSKLGVRIETLTEENTNLKTTIRDHEARLQRLEREWFSSSPPAQGDFKDKLLTTTPFKPVGSR